MHNETGDTQPWSADRTYADRVAVRIRIVESAADDAEAVEEWRLLSFTAAWTPDWLIDEVEGIALNAGSGRREFPAEYYIHINESRMNWGADVSVFEILVGLASWAATSAAWDATKSLAGRMSDRLRGEDDADSTPEVPSDTDATTAAIEQAVESYNECLADLTVESAELSTGQATVTLRSASGWKYEYELHISGSDVRVSRIRRSRSV